MSNVIQFPVNKKSLLNDIEVFINSSFGVQNEENWFHPLHYSYSNRIVNASS